jgi:hypothetical protein
MSDPRDPRDSRLWSIGDRMVPAPVAAHMYRAATELAQLSPDDLADFLVTYLQDRAMATQDIEDITDDAIDDAAFATPTWVISISPNTQS